MVVTVRPSTTCWTTVVSTPSLAGGCVLVIVVALVLAPTLVLVIRLLLTLVLAVVLALLLTLVLTLVLFTALTSPVTVETRTELCSSVESTSLTVSTSTQAGMVRSSFLVNVLTTVWVRMLRMVVGWSWVVVLPATLSLAGSTA